MADHAVGGVGGFVDHAACETAQRRPQDRGDDPIREILGQALDGGARYPGFVEHGGVAADDHADGGAAFIQAQFQSIRNSADVLVQAALGGQARGEKCEQQPSRP